MRRILTLTLLTCIPLALTLSPKAEGQKRDPRKMREEAAAAGITVKEGRLGARSPQGIGIVQYDPGAPVGVRFADPPYVFIGNLFDTQNGQPLSPGTVYAVSWYQGPATSKGGYPTLMIIPSSLAAPTLIGITGPQTYATNFVSFPPVSVNPPFFVGFNAQQPQADVRGLSNFTQIGFATQSANGQGFHGSQRTFSGGGAGTRAPIQGQNLIVRTTGNIVIPVELMEFEVD